MLCSGLLYQRGSLNQPMDWTIPNAILGFGAADSSVRWHTQIGLNNNPVQNTAS